MAEVEPLYSSEEMRAAEAGHDVEQLMQRAGAALATYVLDRYARAQAITAVCGAGNNGGDTRIAARLLAEQGKEVRIVEVKPEDEEKDLGEPGLVLDGIFGTGFSGEPRAGSARLIQQINALGADVVAVDVPSGVDASTGEIAGAAVQAKDTVTFHAPKVGLVVAPGRFRAGFVSVARIGLEHRDTRVHRVRAEILRRVPERHEGDNKYSAGSVLVVGGAPGTTGAVRLAAEAAFRADAGYVMVAVPPESLPVVEQQLLEAVKLPLSEVEVAAERASAIAIGPGLGRGPEQKALVRRMLESIDLPAVVDADALFELEPVSRTASLVLTPHSGELARLLGESSSWVDAHRLEAAQRGADRFGAVCLLKGADTIVAAPGEGPLVSDLGTPVLATAGTGDVLTGVVAAFLSKGMEPRTAAAAAAAAQQVAAESFRVGMVAGDIVHALPRALESARYR
jgi:NAD(P)H-hydrate epimerase